MKESEFHKAVQGLGVGGTVMAEGTRFGKTVKVKLTAALVHSVLSLAPNDGKMRGLPKTLKVQLAGREITIVRCKSDHDHYDLKSLPGPFTATSDKAGGRRCHVQRRLPAPCDIPERQGGPRFSSLPTSFKTGFSPIMS